MQSANTQFRLLKDEFLRIAKNILIYRTESRSRPAKEKINTDVTNLCNAYDNLITFLSIILADQQPEQQEFLIKGVEFFSKPKLLTTLLVYNLTVTLPNNFERINCSV